MLPIQKMISPYNHYSYNNPQFIVIHYVGAVSTAKNNAVFFNGDDRNASSHYFVDDNEIWQSVEDNKGAWHVGNTMTNVNNWNSIGVEQCCEWRNGELYVSEATEANAVELVKYLMKKYNIDINHVVTHWYVAGQRKICPNWNANDWIRFENFKKKVTGTSVTQPPSNPIVAKPKINVTYKVFTNQDGWYSEVVNLNDYAGLYGKAATRIMAKPSIGTINYRVHRKGYGWLPYVQNYNDYAGWQGIAIDGLQCYLSGVDKSYVVKYRVHTAEDGWLPWVYDLQDYAGIYGHAIDGIQIEIK